MPSLGYWNAHSDRDYEDAWSEPDELDDLSADVEAAAKWVRAYEDAHGPLKPEPCVPDFMIVF
jgi:hypothetical protein